MNMQDAVRQQLGMWHGVIGQMISDCPPDVLCRRPEGSTANTIAATFAHVVLAEDILVQSRLRGEKSLYEAGGWEARTGVAPLGLPPSITDEWARRVKLNVEPFMEYAETVYAATDAYLAGLSDAEVDRKLPAMVAGGQEYTAGWLIANVVATHVPEHAGEIAALRGLAGLKGLPF